MITHYIVRHDNGGVVMQFIMKISRGIKNGFLRIINFIRDGVRELKKVRWPSRKELISYSTVVIFTVVFVTVFFFVVDLGVSSLLQLVGLGK